MEIDLSTYTGELPADLWKIVREGDLILASCWAREGCREWVVVEPPKPA
jgi:hypothetical protein